MQGASGKRFFVLILFLVTGVAYSDNAQSIAYASYLKGVKFEETLYAFEARDAFRKALVLDPENNGYITHNAWFLHMQGFREQAIPALKNALNDPQGNKTEVRRALAWDTFYLGRLAESLRYFKTFYTSRWLNSNYTNAFTKAPLLANEESRAKIVELKKKLARDPNNIALKTDLFNNYIYDNEFRNAVALGKELMANKATDLRTRLEYARVLFTHKEFAASEAQYRHMMQRLPRNAYIAHEWGTKLVRLQRFDEAHALFTQSLSYYPSPEAREALAKLEARKGQCQKADRLLAQVPDKRSIGYMVAQGDVYRDCKQYAEASTTYQKILDNYPYNSDALWGVLSSTAASHAYEGNRVAYDRWQEVYNWERSFLQKQLVNYYQSPMVPVSASFYDSSVTFRRQDGGIAYDFYAKSNTRLNIADVYSGFEQNGFNSVQRNMVQLQGSKLFTEHWQIFGSISDKAYTNHFNNINGDAAVQYSWSETLNATLRFNHSDIIDTEPPFGIQTYNYIVAIGSVGLNIRTDDYSASMYYQPTQNLSLWGRGIYGKYSDGNNKTQASFEANYKLIIIPMVRVMYDFFYLNYSNPAPIFTQNNNSQSAYYDPLNLQLHSARVRVEHFFTPKLWVSIEDAVSWFPQNSSMANGVVGNVDYKIYTHLGMKLSAQYYNQNDTVLRNNPYGGPFWAKSVNLSLIYKV